VGQIIDIMRELSGSGRSSPSVLRISAIDCGVRGRSGKIDRRGRPAKRGEQKSHDHDTIKVGITVTRRFTIVNMDFLAPGFPSYFQAAFRHQADAISGARLAIEPASGLDDRAVIELRWNQ